ncbi:MAG: His/Gly/Thr/Pro-type tRNA ligase C-terminal domain-containing protein, partial [Bulleidia sp.]
NEASRQYFQEVLASLDALGIPYEVDDRLVRGLDYYTHTVFEVKSVRPDAGAQSTIFAGGRYDHLIEYFGGPEMSGIGFAIGMERLLSLAADEGHVFPDENTTDVYVIGIGNTASSVLPFAEQLRAAGFVTEGNLVSRSLKAQFKSADRSGAKYIAIMGEDEVKNGTVNLKKAGGDQVSVRLDQAVDTLKQWEEGK